MRKVDLATGKSDCAFSSTQYVKAVVRNVVMYLRTLEEKLPMKAVTPIQTWYRPVLDTSVELGSSESAYYQSFIGVLRWMVELGQVEICLEVPMMSSHLALPRLGHLQQV